MESSGNTPHSAAPIGHGKARLGLMAGVIVFGRLFFLGYLPRLPNKAHLEAMAQEVKNDAASVSVVTPRLASDGDLLLPGNVQAIEETVVNARTSGYLKRRLVDIGSRVKAGQLLAEIESPEIDQQLIQAQAETARSQAASGQSQADTARLQAGVEQAQSETLRLQAGVEQSRAALASSNAKLARARAQAATSQAKVSQAKEALAGKQGELAQTQAQLDIAEKTLKRWKEMQGQGAVAIQDVDERQSTFDTSREKVNTARSAIEAARADVRAAEENLKASQSDIEAAQADVNASRQNVTAAQAAVHSSRASVRAAQAGVRANREGYQATRAAVGSNQASARRYEVLSSFQKITAPFDGVITSRNVDAGALVKADTDGTATAGSNGTTPKSGLFGIARTDTLRIQVNVPQSFVGSIHPGQTTTVLFREYPGQKFTGTVFQSAGALDSATRTLLTEIHLPNRNNLIRPGMYAQVQFAAPGVNPLPRIQANTLVTNADGPHVLVVTSANKVHQVPVTVGRDFGPEIEIVHGLKGDERLITNPTDDLKEGVPVQVLAPQSDTQEKK